MKSEYFTYLASDHQFVYERIIPVGGFSKKWKKDLTLLGFTEINAKTA